MYKTGITKAYRPEMQALQVPDFIGITDEFVEAVRERNLQIHVWTVNETKDMERLLKTGIDGIMTDYPDRLLKLLKQPPSQ
jgi:glycerophosphoryl diester phosphodiesterase